MTNINSNTNSNQGNGLTFAGVAETLYLLTDSDLATVDPASGVDTIIATLSLVGFPALVGSPKYVAAATRPSDGVVFVIVKDYAQKTDTYLGTLNLTTGAVTLVGKTTEAMEGISFVPLSSIP